MVNPASIKTVVFKGWGVVSGSVNVVDVYKACSSTQLAVYAEILGKLPDLASACPRRSHAPILVVLVANSLQTMAHPESVMQCIVGGNCYVDGELKLSPSDILWSRTITLKRTQVCHMSLPSLLQKLQAKELLGILQHARLHPIKPLQSIPPSNSNALPCS